MRNIPQSPSAKYQEILRIVGRKLSHWRFHRSGGTFRRRADHGWQIINFQKSRTSTQDRIKFTVNLGTCLDTLLDYFDVEESSPSIEDSHWRQRLMLLVGTPNDEWLDVDEQTTTAELTSYLIELLAVVALPILVARSSEDCVASYWLTGASEGLTEPQRLMNLAVLMSKLKHEEGCKAVCDELERKSADKPWRPLARTIIAQLSVSKGE